MGYWSEKQIEMTEGGMSLWHAGEQFVCSACVEDAMLKRFIAASAVSNECSYCNASGNTPIAVSLAEFVRHLFNGINLEWGDASDYEYRDDETRQIRQLVDGVSTRDLLTYELELRLPLDETGALLNDVIEGLPDRQWCREDPLASPMHESICSSWRIFCDVIKHERRFFFLQYRDLHLQERIESEEAAYDVVDFLKNVAEYCKRAGLITKVPAGERYFRCQRKIGNQAYSPRRMGPPPKQYATQANRMSPAGVPMFYGAELAEVALAETTTLPDRFAVGQFEAQRDLVLLDLRQAPEIPSLFDQTNAQDRPWARFMREFVGDFQKPISRDNSEHVEYVPTQVVTEYFRTVVRLNDQAVDGILYSSTRCRGETAVVLFADTYSVEDLPPKDDNERWLARMQVMAHPSPWLTMVGYEEVDFDPTTRPILPAQ